MSSLERGVLSIEQEAGKCQYRAINLNKEKGYSRSGWKSYNRSKKPIIPFDFVEVSCSSGYRYGHHQIFVPMDERERPANDKRPNIYLFGIDAMSNQMFHRYLYRTAYWAEHEMEGVNFINYGKVAKNSIPNQFPVTFGKMKNAIPNPTDFDKDYPSEFNNSMCSKKIPLTEQFISLVYKDIGYRVARIYDDNMVHDISCKGFQVKIHDHGDYPFYSYFSDRGNLANEMHKNSCRGSPHDYFDHFMKYVKADSKKPKFMIHMIVKIGHDDPRTAASYDRYFHDGFRRDMDKFDNDFLIFWSDHGNHFGKIFESEFGFQDTRNPLFTIIPPKRFRGKLDNPIYKNLLENSKKLTGPFDFYATLVDLATADFEGEDFTKPFTLEMAKNRTNDRVKVLHGSSIIRPITRHNDCKSAHIPFNWCLCEYQFFSPNDTETVVPQLQSEFIDYVVQSFGVKKTNIAVQRFGVKEVAVKLNEGRRLFYVKLLTKKISDRTRFEGYMQLEKDGKGRFVGRIEP
ncbi:hypothetical protein FO519_004209 [Halicephalobus sp. NKZ332]|nr:hypothetical protein FO519_004209 [Halicephalobus sp. NKZ332]